MRIVCIFLVFHSPIQLLSEEYCEVCELRDQLRECRARLGAGGEGEGLFGQVCSGVGAWWSTDRGQNRLRPVIQNFVQKLKLDESSESIEKTMIVSLTPKQISALQQYATTGKGSQSEIEHIFVESFKLDEGLLSETSDFFRQSVIETSMHFKANHVIIFQVAALLACFSPMLVFGRTRLPLCLLLLFGYAVMTSWCRLYYTAAARKRATLAKLSSVPRSCLLSDSRGWLVATQEFIGGLFNRQEDPCDSYYQAVMVDPAWEVGLVPAVMETFSSCILVPARTAGEALGSFYVAGKSLQL